MEAVTALADHHLQRLHHLHSESASDGPARPALALSLRRTARRPAPWRMRLHSSQETRPLGWRSVLRQPPVR